MMSGPNKGYGYVSAETYSIGPRQWRINKRITRKGPAEVRHVKANGDTVFMTHWDYLI